MTEVETTKISKRAAFVRKWLPFVGLVLVFLTFLVKDVYRDKFKDLAATVDSAESLFIITDTLRVSPDYARELENLSEKKPAAAVREMYRVMQNEQNYIKASIETTRRLLERLPGQDQRIRALEHFQIRFFNEATEMNLDHALATDNSISETAERATKQITAERGTKQISAEEAKVLGHFPRLLGMYGEVKKLSRDALDVAETMRGFAERHYELAAYWSWAFFGLGLLVVVIGRRYRVEGVKLDE